MQTLYGAACFIMVRCANMLSSLQERMKLPLFVAHYRSPNASGNRARGLFEFESNARLGSKANAHDARVKMLELYGNEALAWTVTEIVHKRAKATGSQADGQLELDFREPHEVSKRKRSTKRGVL